MKPGALAALALLVTACQSESVAVPADRDGAGPTGVTAAVKGDAREPLAVPPADPCDDPRNPGFDPDKCVEADASVAAYAGEWEISRVHVSASGVQAFLVDDPAICGSRFRISAEDIRWTRRASETFTADDVCLQPSAGALPAIVEAEEGQLLVESLAAFSVPPAARGPLHRFGCVSGGRWGPGDAGGGALFIPAGADRIALQWYDGAILLAERKRP